MQYLTNEEYRNEISRANRYSKQKAMQQEIKDAQRGWKKDRPKLETSKKLAIYLFILMNVVIVYCLISMWWFADFTYLGVLITDIAAQILIYAIYCLKAYKGKKASEDMAFRRERLQGIGEILDAGSEAKEQPQVKGNISDFNYNNYNEG